MVIHGGLGVIMDDREAAHFYQQHKGDADVWEKPEPARAKRRLASMVSVRFSPEEEAQLRAAAERRGVSVSGLVRAAALREIGVNTGAVVDFGSLRPTTGSLLFQPKVEPLNEDFPIQVGAPVDTELRELA